MATAATIAAEGVNTLDDDDEEAPDDGNGVPVERTPALASMLVPLTGARASLLPPLRLLGDRNISGVICSGPDAAAADAGDDGVVLTEVAAEGNAPLLDGDCNVGTVVLPELDLAKTGAGDVPIGVVEAPRAISDWDSRV